MTLLKAAIGISITFSVLTSCSAWGAAAPNEDQFPRTSFQTRFPTNPTVIIAEGGSVSEAQSECDQLVGQNFCTIQLTGNPSDYPIDIYRSRTKLTSTADVVLSTSGAVSFIELSSDDIVDVLIEGLDLKGHQALEVYGIFISGQNMKRIIVKDCKIHDFDGAENAHGIAVYGAGESPIQDVHIVGNEVYNMQTGFSESIVINGFVKRWAITDNHVHDVNNIAIDAIGGEGTFPPVDTSGRVLPNPKDAAIYGFIEDNLVERMSVRANAAYGIGNDVWAAAIYVDGGVRIAIRRNEVIDSDWAVEIGAENCVTTRQITVTENEASGGFYGDFLAGGYAKQGFRAFTGINCDPRSTDDDNEGHGYVRRITVRDNMFASTTPSVGNIFVQNRLTFAIIAEPGAEAVNEDGNGSATGDDNAIRIT